MTILDHDELILANVVVMKSLGALLEAAAPREIGGPTASNRFGLQKNWTICKLIDLHLEGREYVVFCDFHEDVLIADDETDPTEMLLIQIKSDKTRSWSAKRLVAASDSKKKDKGKKVEREPMSPLAKLYSAGGQFKDFVRELRFVCTTHYSVKLSNGKDGKTLDEIKFNEISDKEKDLVIEALQAQLNMPNLEKLEPPLILEVSPLGHDSHTEYTKGKLADFFEQHCPGKAISSAAAHRSLFAEVERRINEGQYTTLKDLVLHRGFSKAAFQNILELITGSVEQVDCVKMAIDQLRNESQSPAIIARIGHHMSAYEVARMDTTDEHIQKKRESAVKFLEANDGLVGEPSLSKVAEIIASNFEGSSIYEAHYYQAIAIYEYYQYQFQKAATQSKKKA